MSDLSELSQLVWFTDSEGPRPGMVEVRRDGGRILARLWSEVLDGGYAPRAVTVGDVMVTSKVPTGIIAPSTRWDSPSELALELMGPPRIPEAGLGRSLLRRSQATPDADPEDVIKAQALADEATSILVSLPNIGDYACSSCGGTGHAERTCTCVTLGVGAGVVDLDTRATTRGGGDPDPACVVCEGSGIRAGECWRCSSTGVLCAPYDITIGLDDHTVVIPGQPGELAALSPVRVGMVTGSVSWGLSQLAPFKAVQNEIAGHELMTPAGFSVLQVPLVGASVSASLDGPWPEGASLASMLATKLADDASSRVSRWPDPGRIDEFGYMVDESGMVRGIRLDAREPLCGESALGSLLERTSGRGLRVVFSVSFIATGEAGPQVSLLDMAGRPVHSFTPQYRLTDAIQGAVLAWDRLAES